jgi:hypothetical protein
MAKRIPVDPEWHRFFADKVWPSYPRKVAKLAAWNAWDKLWAETGDPTWLAETILEGIAWYAENEWQERDPQHIPHLSTWLNQRRWEDAQV